MSNLHRTDRSRNRPNPFQINNLILQFVNAAKKSKQNVHRFCTSASVWPARRPHIFAIIQTYIGYMYIHVCRVSSIVYRPAAFRGPAHIDTLRGGWWYIEGTKGVPVPVGVRDRDGWWAGGVGVWREEEEHPWTCLALWRFSHTCVLIVAERKGWTYIFYDTILYLLNKDNSKRRPPFLELTVDLCLSCTHTHIHTYVCTFYHTHTHIHIHLDQGMRFIRYDSWLLFITLFFFRIDDWKLIIACVIENVLMLISGVWTK